MDLVRNLLAWVAAHPHWSGLVVALVAFLESLAMVGLLVPGAIIMFGAGALVATGFMPFEATMAWAVLGAVAG